VLKVLKFKYDNVIFTLFAAIKYFWVEVFLLNLGTVENAREQLPAFFLVVRALTDHSVRVETWMVFCDQRSELLHVIWTYDFLCLFRNWSLSGHCRSFRPLAEYRNWQNVRVDSLKGTLEEDLNGKGSKQCRSVFKE